MPANTAHGYPYPLPTEPVAQGAAAIRALAEAIEPRAGVTKLWDSTDNGVVFPAGIIYTVDPLDQTYKHLRVDCSFVCDQTTAQIVNLDFNGDLGTYYRLATLVGSGGGAQGSGPGNSRSSLMANPGPPFEPSAYTIVIPNYSNASVYKTYFSTGYYYHPTSGAMVHISATGYLANTIVRSLGFRCAVGTLHAPWTRITVWGER